MEHGIVEKRDSACSINRELCWKEGAVLIPLLPLHLSGGTEKEPQKLLISRLKISGYST